MSRFLWLTVYYKFAGFHVLLRVMDARRHRQKWALAPLWKCYEVFCALVVTAERSVDELFMHYFHNLSSDRPPPGLGARWGTFIPRPLIYPPMEKHPAGTHAQGSDPQPQDNFANQRLPSERSIAAPDHGPTDLYPTDRFSSPAHNIVNTAIHHPSSQYM